MGKVKFDEYRTFGRTNLGDCAAIKRMLDTELIGVGCMKVTHSNAYSISCSSFTIKILFALFSPNHHMLCVNMCIVIF